MSVSKASSRLRKQYTFSLLCRLGENFCCRCGGEIETAEDLSLDHVEPWRGVSASLFWNLDNIKPAHWKCNTLAVRKSLRSSSRRGSIPWHSKAKDAPEGKKWCWICQEYVDILLFSKDRSKFDGLCQECGPCRSKMRSKGKNNSKYQIVLRN